MGYLNHISNVIFHYPKCNLVEVIEQARNTYHFTLLYNKCINMVSQDDTAGKIIQEQYCKELDSLTSWVVEMEY